jgi:hypothetical protein
LKKLQPISSSWAACSLVYADRLSGWRTRYSTAREIVQATIGNFVDLGVTLRIQTDNGPQLSNGVFA